MRLAGISLAAVLAASSLAAADPSACVPTARHGAPEGHALAVQAGNTVQAEALAEDVAFWHKTGAGPGVAAVMTCPRGRLGEVIFLPEGSESETLQGIRELADKQPNPMSGGFLGFKGQMGRLVASAGGSIDVTDADFGACVCAALAAAK